MAQNSVQRLKKETRNKIYRMGTSENFTFDPRIHDGITLMLPTSYAGTITNTAMAEGQTMTITAITALDPANYFSVPALGAGDYSVTGDIEIEVDGGTRVARNWNPQGVIEGDYSDLETYMSSISMLYSNRVAVSALAAKNASLLKYPAHATNVSTLSADTASLVKLVGWSSMVSSHNAKSVSILGLTPKYATVSKLVAKYTNISALEADTASIVKLVGWSSMVSSHNNKSVSILGLTPKYSGISALVASAAGIVYATKTQTLTGKTVSGGTAKAQTLQIKGGTAANAVNASYSTEFAAASANLLYTAKVAGAGGKAIRLIYVGSKPSSVLAVTVPEANYIRVKLQTNAASAASCTASEVKAAVKAHAGASALVGTPALVSGIGEDIVSSMASSVSLKGGVDGTVGVASQIVVDSTNMYFCTVANTVSGKNWKKLTWVSL